MNQRNLLLIIDDRKVTVFICCKLKTSSNRITQCLFYVRPLLAMLRNTWNLDALSAPRTVLYTLLYHRFFHILRNNTSDELSAPRTVLFTFLYHRFSHFWEKTLWMSYLPLELFCIPFYTIYFLIYRETTLWMSYLPLLLYCMPLTCIL